MAIIIDEKFGSGQLTDNRDSPTADLEYVIQGTTDETLAIQALEGFAPSEFWGLMMMNVAVEPMEGEGWWHGRVSYGRYDFSYQFDTSGGTKHVIASKGTLRAYGTGSSTADNGNLVGVNSSDLANWTTVSTFNVARYSSNSRRIYHALTDHSTRNYWRITFESSSTTYNSLFANIALLSTDPNARGYRGGWPITTAWDKTVTFASQVAASSFKAGTAAGIDATISYTKSGGGTGTLTFTKGLLTAQT